MFQSGFHGTQWGIVFTNKSMMIGVQRFMYGLQAGIRQRGFSASDSGNASMYLVILFIGRQLIAPGFTQRLVSIDQRSAHFRGFLRIFHLHTQNHTPALVTGLTHGILNNFRVIADARLRRYRRI